MLLFRKIAILRAENLEGVVKPFHTKGEKDRVYPYIKCDEIIAIRILCEFSVTYGAARSYLFDIFSFAYLSLYADT